MDGHSRFCRERRLPETAPCQSVAWSLAWLGSGATHKPACSRQREAAGFAPTSQCVIRGGITLPGVPVSADLNAWSVCRVSFWLAVAFLEFTRANDWLGRLLLQDDEAVARDRPRRLLACYDLCSWRACLGALCHQPGCLRRRCQGRAGARFPVCFPVSCSACVMAWAERWVNAQPSKPGDPVSR